MKRIVWGALFLVSAVRVQAGEMTDGIRQRIEPGLPAKLQTFVCPETAEETKELFYCSGAFTDGRWFDVVAKRNPDQTIAIVTKIVFPAAPDSVAKVARSGVTSNFRRVTCSPEAGVTIADFDCQATLADGSRLTIRASRYPQGQVAMEPLIWNPDSPSPLIHLIRSRTSRPVESITCPYELTEKFNCTVNYAGGGTNMFTIRRTNVQFTIIAESQQVRRREHLFGAIAIGLGALAAIAATIWLVMLNSRSIVVRLPFAPEQPVELPAPGAYVLHLEWPALTFIPFWRRLQYSMADPLGREVPMNWDPLPVRSSWGMVRRSVRLFSIQGGGRYVLRAAGVPAGYDVSRWGLIISRSFIARGVLCIAAIAGGALLILGGFIFLMS